MKNRHQNSENGKNQAKIRNLGEKPKKSEKFSTKNGIFKKKMNFEKK